MVILKGLIIFNLVYIIYQDLKSREVYWFLLPSLMVLLGYMHYRNVLKIHFITFTVINIGVIITVLGLLYLYTVLLIKKPFFKEVFGLADALYFLALAMAFPTATFVVIFVFSLIFSLLAWLILKHQSEYNSIPLAGYMSAFLLLIFIGNWCANTLNLYLI